MMKRTVCCLLSLLLLCACALADAPAPYVPLGEDEPSEVRGVMPLSPSDRLGAVSEAFLTGNAALPVYSLPDEDSCRADDGEAACVPDRVTRIFGGEDGWLMIEYAVTEEQLRVGWIRPEGEDSVTGTVNALCLASQSAYAAEETVLTDDPFSGGNVMTLAEGQEVTFLTAWDGWAYVRAAMEDGTQTGGFVPASSLVFRLHEERKDIVRLLSGTWELTSGEGWRQLSFTSGGMAYDGDATLAAYCAVYDIEQGLELVLTDDHGVTAAWELTFAEERRFSLTDGEKVTVYERAAGD